MVLVLWSAKQQEIIALLTIKAEYIAITHAVKKALWLYALLSQLFKINLNSTTLFLLDTLSPKTSGALRETRRE